MRFIYSLALRLNRFPQEILDRPVEELRAMAAFLDWEAEQKTKD